jgi:ABC-type branched-subunit amino acid transport system substrate-binding protein
MPLPYIIFTLFYFLSQPLVAEMVSIDKEDSISIGKRIYQKGIGESGQFISSTGLGEIKLDGRLVTCVSCHRRSGFGSSEGGLLIPSITGKSLFNAREFNHRELKKNGNRPITRTAYNENTLQRAVATGIDANNRTLNPIMPRYHLSQSELQHLSNYLKSLGKTQSLGVDDETIHFATIVTTGVSKKKKSAMMAVLTTFFNSKNANTRFEEHRSKKSPWFKKWAYTSYRKWKLHKWKLTGQPDTWEKQLNEFYQSQPVFAVVSGISNSTWQPVHDFCNSNNIPCLFPTTNLPGTSKDNNYVMYFTKGVILEAQIIAKHISESIDKRKNYKIIQILDHSISNKMAANTLSSKLIDYKIKNIISINLHGTKNLEEYLQLNSPNENDQIYLVFWSDILNDITINKAAPLKRVYVTHLLPLDHLQDKFHSSTPIYMPYPFALPEDMKKHLKRIKAWSRANKITPVINEITANTYFSVTLLAMGIKHLRTNFSQDYLIERFEHMVDNSAFHSVYRHLSLGPDQRYASKGSYIIGPIEGQNKIDRFKTVRWIVP